MELLLMIVLTIVIVFVVQLIRVARYLKRANNIDKKLTRVIAVLMRAPFNADLRYPNYASVVRVSCVYYWGIASGRQFSRSKLRYPNYKG